MKVITAIAAATLLLGITAASAQTPSPSASKPGATVNTDKEVPAIGTRGNHLRSSATPAPRRSTTTGSGISEPTGVTPGSNPNPSSNRNPDPEVPGNTEE